MPATRQPLLALAAALIDLRQLTEADSILRAADQPALQGIPARAGLAILRARVHLAAGRLADAAADGHAALGIAEGTGAHGYAATAHSVLAMIELRRGDIAAAAQHLACRPAASPIVQTTGAHGYAATAHSVPSVIEPRGGDVATAVQRFVGRPAAGPQFADLYARQETTLAEAWITEARDGAAAALGRISRLCADLGARPGLLLGDPALAAWLVRTAWRRATESWPPASPRRRSPRRRQSRIPGPGRAAAHSRGLASQDPARMAEAAARHPDPWARASAAEDLGVLCDGRGDREQAIRHLKEALAGYRRVGADRDQARIRHRLRQLGIRRRHWATQPPARHRVGQPDRHRAGRRRPGRRGAEQWPGGRPHVHQHSHRGAPSAPGLPQAQHRLTRRTHPHRHRAGDRRRGNSVPGLTREEHCLP